MKKLYQSSLCDNFSVEKGFLNIVLRVHPYLSLINVISINISMQLLQRHLLTHISEKVHQSSQCDKALLQENQLIIHLKTHPGERPYKGALV